MRVLVPVFVAVLCLAPSAHAGPEAAKALGERLADADLDVAYEASKKLLALGSEAKPAVEHLVAALDRELPDRIRMLHWHPWQGIVPDFHRNLVRTLGAIGPPAAAAVPKLAAELDAGSRHELPSLVAAVLAIAPDDPAVFDALCGVISRGHRLEDPAIWAPLQPWIEAQGAKVVPALDGLMQNGRAVRRQYAAKRLAALGTPGLAVLRSRLAKARPNERNLILDVLIASGNLAGSAVDVAIAEFVAGHFSGEGERYARAFALAGAGVDRKLAVALAETPFGDRAWLDLQAATPGLAHRTTAAWIRVRKVPVCVASFDERGLRRTQLAGGGGGTAFEDRISQRATLTGLHVHVGGWGHRTIVRGIRPLFDGPEGRAEGAMHGTPDHAGTEVRAKPGYAVAGLFVRTGHRVDGLAVLFLRLRQDGRLDPKDGYVSPWIGGRAGSKATIGGTGARIVGLTGRSGADLDAIGLVESEH